MKPNRMFITTPATKGGWVHAAADTPLGGQLYQTPHLIGMLKDAASRKCVVTLNLEIYQDGTISRAAVKQLAAVKEAIKGRRTRSRRAPG